MSTTSSCSFTRKLGPRRARQRSKRFRPTAISTPDALDHDLPVEHVSEQYHRRQEIASYTRLRPSGRQRSKRFRPSKTLPPCAELSITQLLPVELNAPANGADPVVPNETIHRAEFDSESLLSVEYAAPAPLPHASAFPAVFTPPIRDNTAPRCNAVHRTTPNRPLVLSTLNEAAWQWHLRDYPDRAFVDTLTNVIRYGADIGFTGDRSASQPCSNLKSAKDHPNAITSDIDLQLSRHRTMGPFSSPPLPSFRTSPLGVATRKRSSKLRRIHHLSWPHGSSVNDGILDSEASITYETFSNAVQDLLASGPGSRFVKLDLEHAFRHIPVQQADWPLLGFTWLEKFYYDIVLAFGLRSAPYIFNLFAEGLHWILQRHLPALIRHLLDDFLEVFRPDIPLEVVTNALHWTLALGQELGLQFNNAKVEGPTTCIDFLGLTLDSVAMEARLPPDKLDYLNETLVAWLSKSHCTLRELQELTGYLQFCSQVIPHSRAFIQGLLAFARTFSSCFSRRRIPRSARADLRWWLSLASQWNGVQLLRKARPSLCIHTDASGTKGAGGVFGSQWFSTRIPRRYQHRDIQFKELFAIVHAILCWGPQFTGHHIIFHTDNQAIHSALQKLAIRSSPVMTLVRQFLALASRLDFTFEVVWIPTDANALADAASRFQYSRLFTLAPHLHSKPSSKILSLCPPSTLISSNTPRPVIPLPFH